MSVPQLLTIATRKSPLALWQSEHVADRLRQLYPDCHVQLLSLSTKGDDILDRSLQDIGGKGLFIKELEVALADGRADLAVHSMKDIPMHLADDFSLAAILQRQSPFDALVNPSQCDLADLPQGAKIGTASARRAAIIKRHYPHLRIELLRGNVNTRLQKLHAGQYDAIIMAEAGLRRLALDHHIQQILPVMPFIPAPGQGAIGIEISSQRPDLQSWLGPLNDPVDHALVSAERAFSRTLNGSCRVPLGIYARLAGQQVRLDAFLASLDGKQWLTADRTVTMASVCQAAIDLAEQLAGEGGDAIISAINRDHVE